MKSAGRQPADLQSVGRRAINIVGAGLAGALLAVLLARRGFTVTLYDRRPDPREADAEGGRSINLALAARGIRALERAGVMARIRPLLIPMRGRMVHDLSGAVALHPYGQRGHEVIYSVGRSALNRVLIEEAAHYDTVTMRFEQTCVAAIPERNVLRFHNRKDGVEHETPLAPTIATDGAGSAIRASLASARHVTAREDRLDHDYKELTIPAPAARHVLDGSSLHVWPRRGFMLVALPNTDGSFTATLFLAREGHHGFTALRTATTVEAFFRREFPDALPLMPDLLREFAVHPQGQLGTVHLTPWHVGGSVLLLGDAAHAIVPFHGQGMNAAFEDCAVLDALLDRHEEWEPLFTEFARSRRPDTAAIAAMALENYTEMRDTVLDTDFVRRKALAMELERRFPDRFIPRYSMVMFHPEIPYAEAQRRGAVQAEILLELDSKRDASSGTDAALTEKLVKERLEPIAATTERSCARA
ncbi:MAG: FAD-dependent oxidoreductase [Steroidobacteraceae bacterium]